MFRGNVVRMKTRWTDLPGVGEDATRPATFSVEKCLEFNHEQGYGIVLLKDDDGVEGMGVVRGTIARLLWHPEIRKRLPLRLTVTSHALEVVGDSRLLEVISGVLDPFLQVSATALSDYLACPRRAYLRSFVGASTGGPNRVLLDGTIFHDYLNFLFSGRTHESRADGPTRAWKNAVEPALWRALLVNWKKLAALGVKEGEYARWFFHAWGKSEVEFYGRHLRDLRKGGKFEVRGEVPVQSLELGLRGRVDRIVQYPGPPSAVDLIETKLGKGGHSTKRGAATQLNAYALLCSERVNRLLAEFPARSSPDRFEEVPVEENPGFLLDLRNRAYGVLWGVRPPEGPFSYVGYCSFCWMRDACTFYCHHEHGVAKCRDCRTPCDHPTRLDGSWARPRHARAKAYYEHFSWLLNQEFFQTLDLQRELALPVSERERLGNAVGDLALQAKSTRGERVRYLLARDDGDVEISGRVREGDLVLVAPNHQPATSGAGAYCQVEALSGAKLVLSSKKPVPLLDSARPEDRFRVDLTSFTVVTDREKGALDLLYRSDYSEKNEDLPSKWRDLVTLQREPETMPAAQEGSANDDGQFDPTQRRAISGALAAKDLYLIQGPPGTGKTAVTCEIVARLVARSRRSCPAGRGNRQRPFEDPRVTFGLDSEARREPPTTRVPVLVTAFTHRAVDNVVKGLVEKHVGVRVVRLGSIASVQEPAVREFCLENLCQTNVRTKKATLRGHSAQLALEVLDSADVVATTTASLGGDLLAGFRFDAVVVDEAGQISEPSTLMALLKAERAILVGDHAQLPSISSGARVSKKRYLEREQLLRAMRIERDDALATSMLERLARAYEGTLHMTTLSFQYRMNAAICEFASQQFYGGKLKPGVVGGVSVGEQDLSEALEEWGVALDPSTIAGKVFDPNRPFVFLDTSGCQFFDSKASGAEELESKYNKGEALLVSRLCVDLLGHVVHWEKGGAPGTDPQTAERVASFAGDVGIIAAYRAQVLEIRKATRGLASTKFGPEIVEAFVDNLAVDTVDRFQGKERELVFISLVDSNRQGEISSVVSDLRRLNVSVTRARKKVVVVGNVNTLTARRESDDPGSSKARDAFAALVEHAKRHGGYAIWDSTSGEPMFAPSSRDLKL
ncbi:MAG: hypothetical protein Kow0069_25030 [Promethearchaeota archaeon]